MTDREPGEDELRVLCTRVLRSVLTGERLVDLSDSLAKKVAHHKAVSFFEKGSGLDRFIELVNETLGRKAEA